MTEFDSTNAGSSSKSTPKHMNKSKNFAPASPAFSSKAGILSSAAHKPSLCVSETCGSGPLQCMAVTVAQKIAPMFACYGKTHALLNDYIR